MAFIPYFPLDAGDLAGPALEEVAMAQRMDLPVREDLRQGGLVQPAEFRNRLSGERLDEKFLIVLQMNQEAAGRAPLGVVLDAHWGLASIGLLTILLGAASFAAALRKSPLPVTHGEHLPFSHVLGRVASHGMGLALGGVGYSVLATFVTLFYLSRHWNGAALCLSAFAVSFITARLLFIHTIDRFGGFQVAMVCLSVEALGMILLWRAHSPWMAFAGAALAGFGYSLVFPALGVEAVKRVAENNRGSALAVYTAFADVSFFLVGPIAGAVIGLYGYASAFLFALVSVIAALGLVVVLRQVQAD